MTAQTLSDAAPSLDVAARLRAFRAALKRRALDAYVVRSTDEWLNEYVPKDRSERRFLTGFTGSMGDAVITGDRALLFVDGRYTLQARQEAPDYEVTVVELGTSIEEGWLKALGELHEQGVRRVGFPAYATPTSLARLLENRARELELELVPDDEGLVSSVRDELGLAPGKPKGKAWPVDPSLVGRTVKERLREVAPRLGEADLDGWLSVPLDEVAWMTNLRGDVFPFQATFPAVALVLEDQVLLSLSRSRLKKGEEPEAGVTLVAELVREARRLVEERGSLRVGYEVGTTPSSLFRQLAEAGVSLVEKPSPLRPLRTTKTPAELAHMVHAFRRADETVKRLQSWLSGQVSRGQAVTEADVVEKLRKLFKRSGAWGHSFQTIAGCGPHGAIIHYGTPDDEAPIPEGALFLLDCGAYYEAGLATDLTRTFVVGGSHVKPSEEHRRAFTLVLKGAIAGMSARIPVGTTGEQLDAIVRHPLWQAGLNYMHGTGHGVGVNVHEFPPRVAPRVTTTVQPGQVFSIEPGVYLEGRFGIRIENLCTVEPCPEDAGFLRVRPLTFSPFDGRLIDRTMLSGQEKRFLEWFKERFKQNDALTAPLPPLE